MPYIDDSPLQLLLQELHHICRSQAFELTNFLVVEQHRGDWNSVRDKQGLFVLATTVVARFNGRSKDVYLARKSSLRAIS